MERKIKDVYRFDELIELLEKCYEQDIELNTPKALLTLCYELRDLNDAQERMDNEMRDYDP